MEENPKIYAKGLFVEAPKEGVPDFIKYKLSFKVAEFTAFLQEHENGAGYVNCEIKVSTGGKPYAELNTWKKPETPEELQNAEEDEMLKSYPETVINPDDIPF